MITAFGPDVAKAYKSLKRFVHGAHYKQTGAPSHSGTRYAIMANTLRIDPVGIQGG